METTPYLSPLNRGWFVHALTTRDSIEAHLAHFFATPRGSFLPDPTFGCDRDDLRDALLERDGHRPGGTGLCESLEVALRKYDPRIVGVTVKLEHRDIDEGQLSLKLDIRFKEPDPEPTTNRMELTARVGIDPMRVLLEKG